MHNHNQEKEGNDIIDTLFRLPVKNLESRIKHIEREINSRQKISDKTLSALFTHQTRLKGQLKRLKYLSALSESFIVTRDFTRQVVHLEEAATNEITSCFRDISSLSEKLQEAREELALEQQKLRLMKLIFHEYSDDKS